MRDFTEPESLGEGLTWTAEYRGHDWARRGSFYFLITIRRANEVVKRFPAEIDDHRYGDPTCEYSEAAILDMVQGDLAILARRGEANTNALV